MHPIKNAGFLAALFTSQCADRNILSIDTRINNALFILVGVYWSPLGHAYSSGKDNVKESKKKSAITMAENAAPSGISLNSTTESRKKSDNSTAAGFKTESSNTNGFNTESSTKKGWNTNEPIHIVTGWNNDSIPNGSRGKDSPVVKASGSTPSLSQSEMSHYPTVEVFSSDVKSDSSNSVGNASHPAAQKIKLPGGEYKTGDFTTVGLPASYTNFSESSTGNDTAGGQNTNGSIKSTSTLKGSKETDSKEQYITEVGSIALNDPNRTESMSILKYSTERPSISLNDPTHTESMSTFKDSTETESKEQYITEVGSIAPTDSNRTESMSTLKYSTETESKEQNITEVGSIAPNDPNRTESMSTLKYSAETESKEQNITEVGSIAPNDPNRTESMSTLKDFTETDSKDQYITEVGSSAPNDPNRTGSMSTLKDSTETDSKDQYITDIGSIALNDPSRPIASGNMIGRLDTSDLPSNETNAVPSGLDSSILDSAGKHESTMADLHTNAFNKNELGAYQSTQTKSTPEDSSASDVGMDELNSVESDTGHSLTLHVPSLASEDDFISHADDMNRFNISGFEIKDHAILKPDKSNSTLTLHPPSDYFNTSDSSENKRGDINQPSEGAGLNISALPKLGSDHKDYDYNESDSRASIVHHESAGGSDLNNSKTNEHGLNHIRVDKFGAHEQNTAELGMSKILMSGHEHDEKDSSNTARQPPVFNEGITDSSLSSKRGEESTDSTSNNFSSHDHRTNEYGEGVDSTEEHGTYNFATDRTSMTDLPKSGYDAVNSTGVGIPHDPKETKTEKFDKLTNEGLGTFDPLRVTYGTVEHVVSDSFPHENDTHEYTTDVSGISDSLMEGYGVGTPPESGSNPHDSKTLTGSVFNTSFADGSGPPDSELDGSSLRDHNTVKHDNSYSAAHEFGNYDLTRGGSSMSNLLTEENEKSVSGEDTTHNSMFDRAQTDTITDSSRTDFIASESRENVNGIDETGFSTPDSGEDGFFLQAPTLLASTLRPATPGITTEFERHEPHERGPAYVMDHDTIDVFGEIDYAPGASDKSHATSRGLCTGDSNMGQLATGYSYTCQPDMLDLAIVGSDNHDSNEIDYRMTEPPLVAVESGIDPSTFGLGESDSPHGYGTLQSASVGSDVRGARGGPRTKGSRTGEPSTEGTTRGSNAGGYVKSSSEQIDTYLLSDISDSTYDEHGSGTIRFIAINKNIIP